ncbi:MAG: coiled-coil protein [Candidatus Hodarchaeales archaeon]|jgi:uncharacterized coiled-coil DUF342 family protein
MEQQDSSSNPQEKEKTDNSNILDEQKEGSKDLKQNENDENVSIIETSSEEKAGISENKEEEAEPVSDQDSVKNEPAQVTKSAEEEVVTFDLNDLRSQIGEIESEVRNWRSKREDLNGQVIDKAKTRNELNTKVRELIKNANEEKEKRDKANKEINSLKEEKNKLQSEIEESVKILEKSDGEKDKVPQRVSNRSIKDLEQEIKNLEWKLQTTGNITLQEERDVVERIGILEEKLINLQEFKELSNEIQDARFKVRKNRQALRKTIQSMNKLARESRAHHTTMIEGYHEANKIRKEADTIHAEIQKIKKSADTVHAEYVNKIKEKRKLSDKVKKIRRIERDEQAAITKEQIKVSTDEAVQKTKDGKKITFEDFKNLINRGLI